MVVDGRGDAEVGEEQPPRRGGVDEPVFRERERQCPRRRAGDPSPPAGRGVDAGGDTTWQGGGPLGIVSPVGMRGLQALAAL